MKKQNFIISIDLMLLVLVLSILISTALIGEYLILFLTSIVLIGTCSKYIKSRKNYQLSN
jgi:hypothetical protein